jgi:hypothetical protein
MSEVKRNLILHVFPLLGREENWHWHISVIKKYRDLFDGKVIVSCVFGEGLSDPRDVEKMMPREVDFRVFKNDQKLGEMVTFYDQVESVIQEDGWTLRSHTKGVTHRQIDIETIWARAMWACCIKSPPNSKKNCHVMGPMRIAESFGTPVWPHGWFFAGTFFWFRNEAVRSRDWKLPFKDKWFIEWWPGVVFEFRESECLFYDMKHRREFQAGDKRKIFIAQSEKISENI